MHELTAGHASGQIGLGFRKCEWGKPFSVESTDALDGANPDHAACVNSHAPHIAADQAVLFAKARKCLAIDSGDATRCSTPDVPGFVFDDLFDRDAPAQVIPDVVASEGSSVVAEQVAFAADPNRSARILKHGSHDTAYLSVWIDVDDERSWARLRISRLWQVESFLS